MVCKQTHTRTHTQDTCARPRTGKQELVWDSDFGEGGGLGESVGVHRGTGGRGGGRPVVEPRRLLEVGRLGGDANQRLDPVRLFRNHRVDLVQRVLARQTDARCIGREHGTHHLLCAG